MAEPEETTPAANAPLEAETDTWEADSAVGESIASSTTSIGSSILKYREENGRTYHAYKYMESISALSSLIVPPNVVFEIDDLEENWTFTQKFDFIFSRIMVGALANFPRFFEQSIAHLSPGGWIELEDSCFPIQCDDDSLAVDAPLRKWSSFMMEAFEKSGRSGETALYYKKQLADVGFTNINQTIYKWPSNRWPRDKKYKEIGMWVLEDLGEGLEALSVALFTRVLGWSKLETDIFLASVKRDMKDISIRSYWNVYCVYAQKPLEASS